jgi:hypothetical protein
MQTRILQDFIVKKKQNKAMYPKMVLNRLKVMTNFNSIYTHWTPSSKKFLKKFPIYMWPMRTHVWTMNELRLNWKWTQLRVNLNLIKS